MKFSDKILLAILVSWVFSTPLLITGFLEINYGFPQVPFLAILFYGIPMGIVLLRAAMQGGLKLPYFSSYLLLIITFSIVEYSTHSNEKELTFVFVKYISVAYSIFVSFINISRNKLIIKYIIKYSIVAILISVFLSYLWYLGLIDLTRELEVDVTVLNQDTFGTRFGIGGVLHPNGLSLACSVVIVLILISETYENIKISTQLKVFVSTALLSMIALNASRGAFVITILALIIYVIYKWNIITIAQKVIGGVLLVVVIFVLGNKILFVLTNSYLSTRFNTETSLNEARGQQIFASLYNFYKRPLSGNGWKYSVADYAPAPDLSRSNFIYTQILGASGIFVFIFFMIWQFNLFGFKNLKQISLKLPLFILVGYSFWMFYNLSLTLPLCIIMALNYYAKNEKFLYEA